MAGVHGHVVEAGNVWQVVQAFSLQLRKHLREHARMSWDQLMGSVPI